jgi:hypothetical protein
VERADSWWHPHATLAYLDARAAWAGQPPAGTWFVDAIELWGGAQVERFPLEVTYEDALY